MTLFKTFNHHGVTMLIKILFGNENTSDVFNKAMQV